MSVFNTTIVEFAGGKCTSRDVEIDFNDPDELLSTTLGSTKVVLNRTDASTQRMIPECVDDGGLTFLQEIAKGIYKPDVDDIERCYYDDMGIPPHVKTYYEGVLVFEGTDVKSALERGFESINSIKY